MKTLLILRHAKSGKKNAGMPDYQRPLKARGKRDAPRIGVLLRREQLVPDLILSSGATRARRTAELTAEACGYEGDIQFTRRLYGADVDDILECLREIEGARPRVMMVGHNPDLELLLEALTGAYHRLPTAALAHLTIPIDRWSDLDARTAGTLRHLWHPKMLDL
jgi:phosphohistidine phosphatase